MGRERRGRLARRCANRIRRYQGSDVRRRMDGVCRFTPSCSEYALEAFEEKPFLVAVGMTSSRLLRCNPLVRRVTRDPLHRHRHPHTPRPGTVRMASLLVMLAGLASLFLMGGSASADPPTGGCTGSANGRPAAKITSSKPLVVRKGDLIRAQGDVPPGKSGPNETQIEIILIDPLGGVTSETRPGNGSTWQSSTIEAEDYLKYGAGTYKVEITNTGADWKCTFVGYIEFDKNPLSTPIGIGAVGVTALGAAGGLVAPRKKPKGDWFGDVMKEGGVGDKVVDAADADRARARQSGDEVGEAIETFVEDEDKFAGKYCLGCAVAMVLLPARAMPIVGMGGGAGVIKSSQRPPGRVLSQRRVYRHGRPILGFFSGLLFGIGATVLLHQYNVWLLNIFTAIVVPVVLGVLFAVYAYVGKPYKVVTIARSDGAPPSSATTPAAAGPLAWQADDAPPPSAVDDSPPPPPVEPIDEPPPPPPPSSGDDDEPPPPAI